MSKTLPTFTLITSPAAHRGSISKAREIAAEYGGNFRAPHFTVSRNAISGEMALAAGGVLLLDQAADFSRSVVSMITNLWTNMDPACRPELIVTLSGDGTDDGTAAMLAHFVKTFEGWTVTEHYTVES